MKRRAMAWLLSAAVICSGFSMPAMAAGVEGEVVQTVETAATEETELESTEADEEIETSEPESVVEETVAETMEETTVETETVVETETEIETNEETETETAEETLKETEEVEEEPQEDIQKTARVQRGVLVPGSNAGYSINTAGDYIELTFRPSVTGLYRIWSTGSVDTVAELYEDGYLLQEDDDNRGRVEGIEGQNFCLQYELKQNVTYTYRVSLYGSRTGAFRVCFDKLERAEIESVVLEARAELTSMVYPFDTEDENDIASSIDMTVTFKDGTGWSGTAADMFDSGNNSYDCEIQEDETVKGKYHVSVYVNNDESPVDIVEITFPTPELLSQGDWVTGEYPVVISEDWKYYSFTPTTNGSYGVIISGDGLYTSVRFCDSSYEYYNNFSGTNIELTDLTGGQTYYVGIRGYYQDGDISGTVKIDKLKEIEKVVPVLGETNYLCGLDYYQEVLFNTSLHVTFMDGSKETLSFDSGQYKWITSDGRRLGYSFLNQDGYEYYEDESIQSGRNTIIISDNSRELTRSNFNARNVSQRDFATLVEQQEIALNTGKKSYQAFWFTPKLTSFYQDVNYNSIQFYTLSNDGSLKYMTNPLIAGVTYLVRIRPTGDVSRVRLTGQTGGQNIKETVVVGHDKTYNFTVMKSVLQLTFTPKKNYEYVIQSFGNKDTKVQLHELGKSTVLASNDENDDDQNFLLSYSLKAGVTYVYTIQLYSGEDTGSFRVTLNGKPHTHAYNWVTTVQVTCAKAGKRHQECSQCGHITNAQNIPATGKHAYGGYITTVQATCAKAGKRHQECRNCGHITNVQTIPATGRHTYGAYRTTKEPTAVATGEKTRSCSVCGKKETVVIPKLKAYIRFNFSGTLPLKVKQSTKAVKVTMQKGDSIASWKSSNKKVATVSKSGKITGKKRGTAKITVKLKSGISKSFKVKVGKATVKTKSIKLSTSKVTLRRGKKLKLKTTIAPITTKDKVKFKTSNRKVATVSKKGVITAKKKGKATITVTCGKKVKRCRVTVK